MPRYNVTFTTTVTETVQVDAADPFEARTIVNDHGSDPEHTKSIDYEEYGRNVHSVEEVGKLLNDLSPLPGVSFLADAFLKDSRT